jgi:hypothetical protein
MVLGQADDARLEARSHEVLGDEGGVGVRVVAADDHQPVEPLLVRLRAGARARVWVRAGLRLRLRLVVRAGVKSWG